MAIEFVGSRTLTSAGGTTELTAPLSSLINGIGSVPEIGDLVIVAVGIASAGRNATATIQTSEGVNYTNVSDLMANDLFDANLIVKRFFWTANELTAEYKITGGSGHVDDAIVSMAYVFRGVDPDTPLDVAVVNATGINTRLANPGSITPVTAGAFIYVAGVAATGTATSAFTSSELTDFISQGTTDVNRVRIGVGYKDDWASGPFDHAAFGGGGTDTTDDSWAATVIALRPAPEPEPDPNPYLNRIDPQLALIAKRRR